MITNDSTRLRGILSMYTLMKETSFAGKKGDSHLRSTANFCK